MAEEPKAAHKPPPPKAPAVMASTPWEGEIPGRLKEQFGEQILEAATYLGQNFVVVKAETAIPALEYLRLECDFDYLVDVTATHWPEKSEQFEVLYILYSFARNERIRVKTRIVEGYKPESAVRVYPGANWMEREVYDMFGIEFANHPNMKRLLLPDDWEGHPLRKDHGIVQMDNRWVQQNLGIESGQ
jgi:NADH-quinone oxidoreductase subunit C